MGEIGGPVVPVIPVVPINPTILGVHFDGPAWVAWLLAGIGVASVALISYLLVLCIRESGLRRERRKRRKR